MRTRGVWLALAVLMMMAAWPRAARAQSPPTIAKAFSSPTVGNNASVHLRFTIGNPNGSTDLTEVAFSDTLPDGLIINNPDSLELDPTLGYCDASGTTGVIAFDLHDISLSGGQLPAGTTCTFSVDVLGVALGDQVNTTGNVTAAESGPGGTASATVTVLPADMTIAKTHAGNFRQGQIGAVYTITAINTGPASSEGTVSVTDTLPASLTATSMTGSGWNCTLATLHCDSADSADAGDSLPPIVLTVNVAADAPGSVVNTVTISGGGEIDTSNDAAADPTTIVEVPDLVVSKTHSGTFTQGQSGAAYTLAVSNVAFGSTSGVVMLTDALPAGLTATGLSGAGWSCTLAARSCARSDPLPGMSSYPAVTLTVSVNSDAASTVTNTATVSTGGEDNTANNTATDPATVNASPLIAPTNLVATATSTTAVQVTWDAVTGASSYQLFRSVNHAPFQLLASPSTPGLTDLAVTPGTTYLYQVRAADPTTAGPFSRVDLATTALFSSDPLVAAVTSMQAPHVTELQAAVNAVRAAAGLAATTFTHTPAAGDPIYVSDVTELRAALDPARAAIGLDPLTYTDPTLAAGDPIKAVHIQELRAGVK